MPATMAEQVVKRLAVDGPPGVDAFAALLGAALRPTAENPDWTFYAFEWPDGPYAGGVLRMSASGDAALLSLSPRDPPGVTEANLGIATWGPRRDAVPRPRISPEGADELSYRLNDVTVSVLLTHTSRRLVTVTLSWASSRASVDDADTD